MDSVYSDRRPVLCDSFINLSYILVLPNIGVCLHLHDITIKRTDCKCVCRLKMVDILNL